jgi:hypothetical protein
MSEVVMKRKITISDIQTTDLLFFDPDFAPEIKDQCFKFCRDRDIDCLPALDDANKVYIRDEKSLSFRAEEITSMRKVDGTLNIFDRQLLQRFSDQSLLLVYSDADLTGVVHFSDYNKSFVSVYLYELFLAYEKNLRTLLRKYSLKNHDMIAYFELKKSKVKREKDIEFYEDKIQQSYDNIKKNTKLPQFEVFYLKDLIALVNHRKIISLKDEVFELRNLVMHAHEFVHMEDPETDDFIYNLASFKKFFHQVNILISDHKRVKNYLAFTSEENHAQTKN